jgi:hypothetical protein
MGMHNFGYRLDPGQLFDKLKSEGALLSSGDLVWGGLERAFPQIELIDRADTTAHAVGGVMKHDVKWTMERMQRLVRRGQICVIHVDAVANDGIADHFVLLADDSWNILDPITGLQHSFVSRYGNLETGIKGYGALAGSAGGSLPHASHEERQIGAAIGHLVIAMRKDSKELSIKNAFEVLTG